MKSAHAIVTGASRGIGLATATRLLADGFRVTTVQRRAPPEDLNLDFLELDLSDLEVVVARIGELANASGAAVLVNNAGVSGVGDIDRLDIGEFAPMAQINLGGAIAAAKAVVPAMRAEGHGRIINLSSRAALGKEGRTFYAATKAGISGLTRTWALELARSGITVNSVSPGPTATEMFEQTNPVGSSQRVTIEKGVPLGRLATPDDIAGAISFLASKDASYITGQTLHVCGGMTIGAAS